MVPIDAKLAPLGCGYWFSIVFGNAIIGYLLAVVNGVLPDGWSHAVAVAAIATTALLFWALDGVVLQRSPARVEIRRAVARILWLKLVLQLFPIYGVIMGHIAIGFIGIHVEGLSYKPVIGPVGVEWDYHVQVFATVLAMAVSSAVPLIAYATVRGALSHRVTRSS